MFVRMNLYKLSKKDEKGIFKIVTTKSTHYSRTILITAGNGAFNVRKLELDRDDKFAQCNLHYFINDLNAFKDRNVMVFGGGDSAVDWAMMLEPIAKRFLLSIDGISFVRMNIV